MIKKLKKPNKKKISHKACSSESSGCDIHVYLFGIPCNGCTHLEPPKTTQKPKDSINIHNYIIANP